MYGQGTTFMINGENEENLYPHMLYWLDNTKKTNSLNEAVFNLEQGNFKHFERGKNLGLYPEPTYFYLKAKNNSAVHKRYWLSFYTHADTIIIYEKHHLRYTPADTLLRNKLLRERKIKHRAHTHFVLLEKDQEQEYLIKIINPRHTQNSFVSLTTPTHHLLWEKGFYYTIGSFIGIFLLTGIVSLTIGIIIKERTFVMFFAYMLTISALTIIEELMAPTLNNKFLFQLLNRAHPLPLSLIATCLNFYVIDYIFGKNNTSKQLKILSYINGFCLATGIVFLVLYMLFMEHINSGQVFTLLAWYGSIGLTFIGILATGIKVLLLAVKNKKLHYGLPFLAIIIFINPAGYYLNYSGIISYYEITYPNYFYWFASGEFIFFGFLMGWRYKKNINQKHQLQITFAQKELLILNDERKQIARDLHDDLGATINAVKLLVTHSYPTDKHLIETVNSASNDIRLFYNKLTHKTTESSLRESIEKLAELHNSYGQTKFSFIFRGNENLMTDILKENIYKIISEIFTNTQKHAHATEATVQVLIDNNATQLLAEDNGTGFPTTQTDDFKGMGIKNIKQRVAFMNGQLHISSSEGNTTYIIEIPLKK